MNATNFRQRITQAANAHADALARKDAATTDNVPAESSRAQPVPLHVRLRQAREEAGLTQGQAAEKFGCAVSGIHQIENGTIRLLPRRLEDLLSIYGVRVELVPVEDVAP
ncbi:hypothetical protein GCM10009555_017910 [Acrocarpospora macrocephala]|uniref:HTH cro/C1-type domain-containing protein n=1 Tax=Acrocarpospora macrocephala TaxID=150177 RepID=A0A5M3WJS7_9ACTN|nr:helix-turn-helix transcriptional regulator [Acrocarpospora macrocephala]GES07451.1 hypothetical protein Amac_010460 [Acrocarpospora macrocephala]